LFGFVIVVSDCFSAVIPNKKAPSEIPVYQGNRFRKRL